MSFRQTLASGITNQRVMPVYRRWQVQHCLKEPVNLCHRCQIGAAHNQGDIAICIINNGTEVIGGRAVSPSQNHIAKFGRIYMMAGTGMILPG